jgi:hypothetical protein
MATSRDPQAPQSVAADSARILSVSDATTYIDEHFAAHIDGITTHPLISERHVRRLLASGAWPCTRTPGGRLGIRTADLEAIWVPEGGRP